MKDQYSTPLTDRDGSTRSVKHNSDRDYRATGDRLPQASYLNQCEDTETLLVFSMADAGRGPAVLDLEPYDLSVEVESAGGIAARVSLSRFRPVPLQFEASSQNGPD